MAAQPGCPAFSNVFHRPATIRMTKASQTMQPMPPKQPASAPPAPRSPASDCISARNGTSESIPPPFLKEAHGLWMVDGETLRRLGEVRQIVEDGRTQSCAPTARPAAG